MKQTKRMKFIANMTAAIENQLINPVPTLKLMKEVLEKLTQLQKNSTPQEQPINYESGCIPNHLCLGRFVHLPAGEQCDKCGGSNDQPDDSDPKCTCLYSQLGPHYCERHAP